MQPDDDDKGEEIAPGVFVRDVSDEEAAATMGISVDELRDRLENIANGTEHCMTLDELLDEWEKDDPGLRARVEGKVAEFKKEMRRKLQ